MTISPGGQRAATRTSIGDSDAAVEISDARLALFAYKCVMDWAIRHRREFLATLASQRRDGTAGVWSLDLPDFGIRGAIGFDPVAVENVLIRKGFDVYSVLKAWRARGYLVRDRERGGFTIKIPMIDGTTMPLVVLRRRSAYRASAANPLVGHEDELEKAWAAYNHVMAWASANRNRFETANPRGCLGKWSVRVRQAEDAIAFHPDPLRRQLASAGFDPDRALSAWRRAGILLANDDEHLTRVVRMGSGRHARLARMVVLQRFSPWDKA